MKYFFIIMGIAIHHLRRIMYRSLTLYYRTLFKFYGNNFSFDPNGVYGFSRISVGHNVNLGYRPIILVTRSEIIIGNNVVFGPKVTIREGNPAKIIKYRFSDDEIKKMKPCLLTSMH